MLTGNSVPAASRSPPPTTSTTMKWASATAGNFKVEASEIEIPVCRALPASQNQGESGADRKPETQATPWSETRLDMAQLELFNCLAKQEAAYRARGDQAHAAATRSRMQAVGQA